MKYILSPEFALRGYDNGKDLKVLNLNTLRRQPVSEQMMTVLQMCDGKADLSILALLPSYGNMLEQARKNGWIRLAGEGDALALRQRYRQFEATDYWNAQWSVTGNCNAKCRHCFVQESQRRHGDLSTDEMLAIIEQLGGREVPMVALTGGEPLVRKDLPLLIREMRKRGVHVTQLYTNGFLLTDDILDLLEDEGRMPDIIISFDGVGCHDWMRGVPGAEQMAIRAMELCQRRNVPAILTMCLHKGNIGAVAETVRLAVQKGVRMLRLCITDDISGFSQRNGIGLLDFDEAAQAFLDYIPVFCRERPDITLEIARFIRIPGSAPENYTILPLEHNCTDLKKNIVCGNVRHSFYINDEGRVLPCMEVAGSPLEEECYQITEHGLEGALLSPAFSSFLHADAAELLRENPPCAECPHLQKCGCGCRGESLARRLGMYGVDPNRCAFFLHGWEEKLQRTMENCLADNKP